MKKDLAKTICICKGCKELLEFEHKEANNDQGIC